MARDHVLNTPELLELLLLNLDIRTLLTSAPLVCRQWHDMISQSPRLQQALFFTPYPEPRHNNDSEAPTEPRLNPLLTEDFYNMFDGLSHNRASFAGLPIASGKRREAFMREGASWRRMLVRQPVANKLGVWHWDAPSNGVSVPGSFHQYSPLDLTMEEAAAGGAATVGLVPPPGYSARRRSRGGSVLPCSGPAITMGMLYDKVVSVAGARGPGFKVFWARASGFDFEDGLFEDEVVTEVSDTNAADVVRKVSEVYQDVDAIVWARRDRMCLMGGTPPNKEQLMFRKRFVFPSDVK